MSISPATMRVAEHPVRVSSTQATIRSVVASWQGRTLRVQPLGELKRALSVLEPHETSLYEYSPHAPRLLASLRAEVAGRTPEDEPLPASKRCKPRHTLAEDAAPGLNRCLVCGQRVLYRLKR